MKAYQKDALASLGVTTSHYRLVPGEEGRDTYVSGLLLVRDYGKSTQAEFGAVEQYYVDDRGAYYAYTSKPSDGKKPKRLGRFRTQREALAAIVEYHYGVPPHARSVERRRFRPVTELTFPNKEEAA